MTNIVATCKAGFTTKAFHFYGRDSRREFWIVYLATLIVGPILTAVVLMIPIVGSLLVALSLLYIFAVQFSAQTRRLHDIDRKNTIAALPYIFLVLVSIAATPLSAMYPDFAVKFMVVGFGAAIAMHIGVLYLCSKSGTVGNNRFGTDPLSNERRQDFINPRHMANVEYLGDPWRRFKEKVEREKREKSEHASQASQASQATPNYTAVDSPSENNSK